MVQMSTDPEDQPVSRYRAPEELSGSRCYIRSSEGSRSFKFPEHQGPPISRTQGACESSLEIELLGFRVLDVAGDVDDLGQPILRSFKGHRSPDPESRCI